MFIPLLFSLCLSCSPVYDSLGSNMSESSTSSGQVTELKDVEYEPGQDGGDSGFYNNCPLKGGYFLLTNPDQDRIEVYNEKGKIIEILDVEHEYFKSPSRIIRNHNCNILIADWQTYTIFEIDQFLEPSVYFRNQFFEEPMDMFLHNGDIVAVWNDSWAVTYHTEGKFFAFYVDSWTIGATFDDDGFWLAHRNKEGTQISKFDSFNMSKPLEGFSYPEIVNCIRYDKSNNKLLLGLRGKIFHYNIKNPSSSREELTGGGEVYQIEFDESGKMWRLDQKGLWIEGKFIMPVLNPERSRFYIE